MSHITCYKTCLKDAAYEGKLKKGGGSQVSTRNDFRELLSRVSVRVVNLKKLFHQRDQIFKPTTLVNDRIGSIPIPAIQQFEKR